MNDNIYTNFKHGLQLLTTTRYSLINKNAKFVDYRIKEIQREQRRRLVVCSKERFTSTRRSQKINERRLYDCKKDVSKIYDATV
jgi:hypothetical protein